MRESKIEREVCKYAKETGWLCYKFSSPGNRGVPDRIFIRKGRIVFIEFKATGNKPTKLQESIISKMRMQGIEVSIIDNIENGKYILQ